MSTSEATGEGDEDFKSQAKYKQFSSAVEKALKAFELSTEWHDLISSLARLNKVLLAYMQYPVVPHHLMVCKRLTQCLHPNLPSGVHIKTLDVYRAIFNRIGPSGLSSDLLAYSSGLFPLITYSSMSVRTQVIEIYEQYFVILGENLRPALHGIVLGLMPGLEDASEHTERINRLLDNICEITDLSFFSSALWQCVLSSPEVRVPAANLILSKLDKKLTAEDQVHVLGGNLPLMVSAICAGLADKNVLAVRSLLDVLSLLFPLHRPFLLPADITAIMVAALETLLKRDISLNRRLFSWLLGSNFDRAVLAQQLQNVAEHSEVGYFKTYSASYVQAALKKLCRQAVVTTRKPAATKLDCVQPYRLLRTLLEKTEISESLIEEILVDLVSCLKEQVESLGGIGSSHDGGVRKTNSNDQPKKLGRKAALKQEILQSANLFFNALNPGFLWKWLSGLLETSLMRNIRGEKVPALQPDTEEDYSKETDTLEDDEITRINSPQLESHPPLSPVSVTFDLTEEAGSEVSRSFSSDQMSCSRVIGLTKFLLKSLPLDSMENAHLLHLPQLSLTLLTCLHKSHSLLESSELQTTLDLVLCIIHELMSSPSSRAATPSTPFSASSNILPRKSPVSTPVNATSPGSQFHSSEQVVLEMTSTYLQFFAGYVRESVIKDGGRDSIFSAVCQLLILVAKLSSEIEIVMEDCQESASSDWRDSLIVSCTLDWESHDHQVTFIAVETMLKLFKLHWLVPSKDGFPGVRGPSITSAIITQPLFTHVSSDQSFLKHVTECLWSCLSFSRHSCHFEAATLLSWLYELLSMPSVCETVILEHFTSDGLEAYRSFAVLWEHSHRSLSQCAKFLHRCVRRMLEGLKSDSPSVRQFVQSWVTFALSRNDDLQALLQPLVKILAVPSIIRKPALDRESEKYRIGMNLSQKDAEKDQAYAKYYYDSLGIPDPMDFARSGQHCQTTCHYSQVIDTRQILYSLSLLQNVIEVDPGTVVWRMGISLIEPVAYSQADKEGGYFAGEVSVKDGVVAMKSLLELVVTLCVDLLRSEYSPTLEAPLSSHLDNLAVRMSSVELLHCLLRHLTRLSAENQGVAGETSPTLSSNFVSALMILCDVQKTALLVLGRVVRDLRGFAERERPSGENIWLQLCAKDELSSPSPEFTLQSFLTQLLLLVYALVALETQCHSKQVAKVTTALTDGPLSSGLKTNTDDWLPPVVTGLSTASQPFFQSLILDILSDHCLSHLHETVLHLVAALLPNLLDNQLTELGSKVLKQACSNLEELPSRGKAKCRRSAEWPGRLTTLYLSSIYSIISWCLFGEARPSQEEERSGYKTINPYWRKIRIADSNEQECALTPTSGQPSTMSWILSVFSASNQMKKSLVGTEEGVSGPSVFSRSRVGVNSRVGQHMLMLLPAVYNAIAEVWRGCGQGMKLEATGNRLSIKGDVEKQRLTIVTQDTVQLVSQLVSSLAHREPSAFFSSVSHVWMEWNLGAGLETGRRESRRKGLFVELLHHVQALPLGGVIDNVQTTLSEIGVAEERQAGSLRQKYLLHFLYKFISSTLQSSEELADCSGQLVTSLREFFNESFTSSADSLHRNSHILCMLTSILHVVVCRVPSPEPKKQKKERKELQDLIHKLCEALSVAASAGISQPMSIHHMTSYENHVTANQESDKDPSTQSAPSATPGTRSPAHTPEEERPPLVGGPHSDSELIIKRDHVTQSFKVVKEAASGQEMSSSNTAPTMQALAVLSSVLSHFVDCAFEGSEKEKVIALLKAIMGNIWPHLQSYSTEKAQSYIYAVKLLSSLSGFQVSRKAWRKEALELFLSPSFFEMGTPPLREWRVVVDNLMTQDSVTFRDLLSKVHPFNASGVVNIFVSVEHEVAAGSRLLKRVGFSLLSAETDQFVEFLPDIQEKLSEYLKVLRHPPICAVVMLVFRVLLVRFSPSHLMAFWPTITSEMLILLTDLENDLCTEVSEGVPLSSDKLQLYLAVCKLLDTAMALPTDQLPHFQLLHWGFSNHDAHSSSGDFVVTKLCKQFKTLGSPTLQALHNHYTPHPTPPYLQSSTISSLRELKPLFTALAQSISSKVLTHSLDIAQGSQFSQADEQQRRMKRIEAILLNDFVESHNQ